MVKLKITGSNQATVTVGDVDLYFSYETCVAFRAPGYGLVVSENVWGVTTGKHLTAIDGGSKERKAARMNNELFKSELTAMCAAFPNPLRS
jgi:hypothetical protein